MSERRDNAPRVDVAALAEFADRIDVRSPAEFALDHVPRATSHPVLDDIERAEIGTLYATSPFAARRLGAAKVARNIARTLETDFAGKSRDWRPLVYCWRGGQRSRALAHILNEIGWRAMQLDGGYRAYRRHVVLRLEALPARFGFVVVCGLTGSGKSRLIAALAMAGAQTLDLEALACHRGSLLGGIPGATQPSQKAFESALHDRLEHLDPARPVFVESESRRVGSVQLPDALLAAMRAGRALSLRTSLAQRIALLKQDYGHFVADAAQLEQRLRPLAPLHGKATLARWAALGTEGNWDALIGELLERHYDPAYARSLRANFPSAEHGQDVGVPDASQAGLQLLAHDILTAIEHGESATITGGMAA
jgi:tRNA 2-selenouridine synthase